MENESTLRQIFARLRHLVWLLVPLLFWWAFRSLELEEIVASLARITWWQALLFLGTNSIIIFLFGLRWRLLIRRTHPGLSATRLTGYWLAGFAVDFSTPAPGVGGEPLLALLLHRRENLDPSAATAAVGLDRLLDASINAAVLTFFSLLVLNWQILHHHLAFRAALLPGLILILLAAVLVPLFMGKLPLNWLLQHLPDALQQNRLIGFLLRSERHFSQLVSNQKSGFALALVVSALSWTVILAEFWLLISFLGIELNPRQLITALTATRLAFLFPLPAGLGALEASLVFAFRLLDLDPAIGLSAALIIRARDLIFITAGLLWGSSLLGGWRQLRQALGQASDEFENLDAD